MKELEIQMISGKRKPGERIPSVRELAAEADVNPNTMQKALQELEREGYLVTDRTNGRYVTEDRERIQEFKHHHIDLLISEFLEKLSEFGLTEDEILSRIRKHPAYEKTGNRKKDVPSPFRSDFEPAKMQTGNHNENPQDSENLNNT